MIILGALLARQGSSGSRTAGLALGFGRFGRLERVFSSVRAARGAGQVVWHSVLAVLAGLAVGWVRSSGPEAEVGRGPHPHPKLEWRSHRPPAWCVCVCFRYQCDRNGSPVLRIFPKLQRILSLVGGRTDKTSRGRAPCQGWPPGTVLEKSCSCEIA